MVDEKQREPQNRAESYIGTLTNAGTIRTYSFNGMSVGVGNAADGTIDTLINSGSIVTNGFGAGIYNLGVIGKLINSGNILVSADVSSELRDSSSYGILNEGRVDGLINSGSINVVTTQANSYGIDNLNESEIKITNSGTIRAESSAAYAFGISNSNSALISTLTNSGVIQAFSSGPEAHGIVNLGIITALNNSGTISAIHAGSGFAFGIVNGSRIENLTNLGMINSSSISGISIGILNLFGSITTLTNMGIIDSSPNGYTLSTGILNANVIETLNNAQGGNGSSPNNTALTYGGVLPNNYNIILNSLSYYGQLATSDASGNVIFGISPLSRKNSTILNQTLASVLSGVTADQLGLTGLTSFSGLSNGYSYSLFLTDLSTNTWGLIITACNSCDIYNGMSVTLNDIDVTAYPVLAGGTLVLNNGDNSSQAFTVTANSTITSPTTGAATLSGVFSGAGGLTFNGTGTTILTGANTYSGGTTVSSGTLSVSGSSPTGTGAVTIASGATLMGRGTITGAVNVSGNLKPGNSPGYLSTTSTVTMNTGSTYLQDIAGTVQASSTSPVGATGYYSFLNVTNGQFVIQPGSTLAPQLSNLFTADQSGFGSAIYVPGLGNRMRIVTAAGGISGKFSAVAQPAELTVGTQFLPFYNMAGSNSIDLAVIPTSYQTTIAAVSGNANAQSVGGALTQIVQASLAGTATAAQNQLLYAISGQSSAQGISNLAQGMSGEVYAATVAVMAQTTQRTQQAVLNRLGDTAGLGMNSPMASAGTTTSPGGAPGAAVSSNPQVNPNAEAKTFSNRNLWGDLAYQKGNRSNDSQSGGWSSNLYQLTFGSDLYSSNGTILGAGFALSSTTVNPVYGSATIQQGSLFAYGKMPVESFVVDAMASIGLSSSDIRRGDVTGLSSGFRNNSVSGNDVMLSLGLSRPMDLESVRITPYARVTWQMVTQSSVNEGDVASALSVNGYSGNGIRGVIGIAAGSKANNPMTAKNTYRAYVGIGADSSGLLNPTLNASLAGMNTSISTPNAGTTFVQAGLYGTVKMSENTFAYAGISGEARSGQMLGTVNVGLKLQF